METARPRRHDDDAPGEIDGLVDVVGDEHHGAALAAPGREELVLQPHPRQGVERAERLVHQQDLGIDRIGAGDGAALLHAAGQGLRQRVGESRETHEPDEMFGDATPLGPWLAGDLEPELDVPAHREPGKQCILLEDDATLGAGSAHVLAVDQDAAGGGQREAGRDIHRGRLAAARGADDGHELAVGDVEREAVERDEARAVGRDEVPADLLERDFRDHARSCQAVSRWSRATTIRSIRRPRIPMAIRLTKIVGRS